MKEEDNNIDEIGIGEGEDGRQDQPQLQPQEPQPLLQQPQLQPQEPQPLLQQLQPQPQPQPQREEEDVVQLINNLVGNNIPNEHPSMGVLKWKTLGIVTALGSLALMEQGYNQVVYSNDGETEHKGRTTFLVGVAPWVIGIVVGALKLGETLVGKLKHYIGNWRVNNHGGENNNNNLENMDNIQGNQENNNDIHQNIHQNQQNNEEVIELNDVRMSEENGLQKTDQRVGKVLDRFLSHDWAEKHLGKVKNAKKLISEVLAEKLNLGHYKHSLPLQPLSKCFDKLVESIESVIPSNDLKEDGNLKSDIAKILNQCKTPQLQK